MRPRRPHGRPFVCHLHSTRLIKSQISQEINLQFFYLYFHSNASAARVLFLRLLRPLSINAFQHQRPFLLDPNQLEFTSGTSKQFRSLIKLKSSLDRFRAITGYDLQRTRFCVHAPRLLINNYSAEIISLRLSSRATAYVE